MLRQEKIEHTEKICVVGLGPTGLAFIAMLLENAQKTPEKFYELNVVEKRSVNFTRKQRLVDIKSQALSTEDAWESFLTNLFQQEKITLQNTNFAATDLNARQKLLKKFYEQGLQPVHCRQTIIKNFSIKVLQKALLEHIKAKEIKNVIINWYTEANIEGINLTKKSLVIKPKDGMMANFEFDILVICEGNGRNVVEQINTAIDLESIGVDPFQIETFPSQLPRYNVSCLLTLASVNEETRIPLYPKEDAFEKLRELGWNAPQYEMPAFILDSNLYKKEKNNKPKIFIASEIPESISELSDVDLRHKRLLAWATTLASYSLRRPEESFAVVTECKEFSNKTKYVKNPIMFLPDGGEIILLGDCGISSVYRLGYSSNIGLNEAKIAASCIAKRNIKLEKENYIQPLAAAFLIYQEKIGNALAASARRHWSTSSAHFFHHKENDSDKILNSALTLKLS